MRRPRSQQSRRPRIARESLQIVTCTDRLRPPPLSAMARRIRCRHHCCLPALQALAATQPDKRSHCSRKSKQDPESKCVHQRVRQERRPDRGQWQRAGESVAFRDSVDVLPEPEGEGYRGRSINEFGAIMMPYTQPARLHRKQRPATAHTRDAVLRHLPSRTMRAMVTPNGRIADVKAQASADPCIQESGSRPIRRHRHRPLQQFVTRPAHPRALSHPGEKVGRGPQRTNRPGDQNRRERPQQQEESSGTSPVMTGSRQSRHAWIVTAA